jgi:GH24 family phage-related lysozyme (muramidase)
VGQYWIGADNQGTYRVSTSFNGAPVSFIGEVKMSDLIDQHKRDTMWLPEDAGLLKAAQLGFASGKPFSDPGLPAAVAKARMLRVQPELVKQIEDEQLKHARDTLSALPRLGGPVDTGSLYKTDRVQNDPRMTVSSAQRFLNAANGGSTGLAASLVTMGEGVMLQAYDDPAQGAGRNIGTGYNLKANAATAERDLKSAGVPQERIPGVLAGTEKLSPEQSDRLTLVAVGRHEAAAQAAVDGVQAGLWQRLQPQQRAVLTDINFQVGNVGRFTKAIGSLVSGDMEAFKDNSRVWYTNRDGKKVEDTRRNALRNAMLSGPVFWQSVLQRSGSQPSSQLDAVATAQ